MSEQQWRVIADRDKGDDPREVERRPGDRLIYSETVGAVLEGPILVRIERPVPTTDEPKCGQWDTNCNHRTWPPMHSAACPVSKAAESPHPPTREQIADHIATVQTWVKIGDTDRDKIADAVLALIQSGANR